MSIFIFSFIQITTGFCFTCQTNIFNTNIKDFVWFEEPDMKFQHREDSTNKMFFERKNNNIEDLVWFVNPDLRISKELNLKLLQSVSKQQKELVTEESKLETEDKDFAKYFFANKWK